MPLHLLTLKHARIVINVVFFVLDLMGFKISVSSYTMERALEKVCNFLKINPEARMAVEKFISAFKTALEENNTLEMAKAIFVLIKDLQAFGLLWMIIESLVFKMSKWDWLVTGAHISVNVIGTLGTGGLALTAKISDAVLSAYSLIGLFKDL